MADQPKPGASLSDILTTALNIVKGINALAANYMNVQGTAIAQAITAPTVLKPSGGRVARVSITTAGSATGLIYDGATLSATSKPIWVIPMAAGANGDPYEVQLPCAFGILVKPGTGQVLSVSYS
jgi:hypothetical protein